MERFAIKINETIKNNLYNICRLCGIDNPIKVPIIEDVIIIEDENEPDLCKKIFDCVGIQVTSMDKMPQKICSICCDKINDFHEFREMCSATNIQTRKLLGITDSYLDIKPIKLEPLELQSEIEKPLKKSKQLSKKQLKKPKIESLKKGNQRKQFQELELEEIKDIKLEVDPIATKVIETNKPPKGRRGKIKLSSRTVEKPTPKVEKRKLPPPKQTVSRVKKRKKEVIPIIVCPICSQEFMTKNDYHVHLTLSHIPSTYMYGCASCMEGFNNTLQVKDHHLWHKTSKTSYTCFRCNRSFEKSLTFFKHMETACTPPLVFAETVPNYNCSECGQVFVTLNLYNWHDCFIKQNTNCRKCNKYFVKKGSLLNHVYRCNGVGVTPNTLVIANTPDISNPNKVAKKINEKNFKKGNRTTKKIRKLAKSIKKMTKKVNFANAQLYANKIVKSEPGSILEIEHETVGDLATIFLSSEKGLTENHVNIIAKPKDKLRNEKIEISTDPPDISVTMEKEQSAFPIISIKQEPRDVHPVIEAYQTSFLQSSSSSLSVSSAPQITSVISDIKREVFDPNYKDNGPVEFDENLAINIKKEKIEDVLNSPGKRSLLKLKIKKEHGSYDSSFVDEADSEGEQDAGIEAEMRQLQQKEKVGKKIYKIPAGLAIKIKQERIEREEQLEQISQNDTDHFQVSTNFSPVPNESGQEIPLHSNDFLPPLLSSPISLPQLEHISDHLESQIEANQTMSSELSIPIITGVHSIDKIQEPEAPDVPASITNKLGFNTFSAIRVKQEFNICKSPPLATASMPFFSTEDNLEIESHGTVVRSDYPEETHQNVQSDFNGKNSNVEESLISSDHINKRVLRENYETIKEIPLVPSGDKESNEFEITETETTENRSSINTMEEQSSNLNPSLATSNLPEEKTENTNATISSHTFPLKESTDAKIISPTESISFNDEKVLQIDQDNCQAKSPSPTINNTFVEKICIDNDSNNESIEEFPELLTSTFTNAECIKPQPELKEQVMETKANSVKCNDSDERTEINNSTNKQLENIHKEGVNDILAVSNEQVNDIGPDLEKELLE